MHLTARLFALVGVGEHCEQQRPGLINLEAIEVDQPYIHVATIFLISGFRLLHKFATYLRCPRLHLGLLVASAPALGLRRSEMAGQRGIP